MPTYSASRRSPHPTAELWSGWAPTSGNLVVDAVILGELRVGILALPTGRKRTQLEHWFDAVAQTVDCLPWDAPVSRRWARLVVELRRKGRTLPVLDSMIAATALHHDLTVATRNTRDFRKTNVRVVDPFI